ncbi:uncharacterized [Tachysurus ichikawai]
MCATSWRRCFKMMGGNEMGGEKRPDSQRSKRVNLPLFDEKRFIHRGSFVSSYSYQVAEDPYMVKGSAARLGMIWSVAVGTSVLRSGQIKRLRA